eukprot:TRINITY_DN8533_c0_g1_i1.p1 TRINITY_DN8533_c0_g1~~TRINITY_DN8533_c0_g1_i1.p1  ORF type:complete len:621 (+),score=105.88 TRINITY_DN8533_c0_g1_i1:212-2074(+)
MLHVSNGRAAVRWTGVTVLLLYFILVLAYVDRGCATRLHGKLSDPVRRQLADADNGVFWVFFRDKPDAPYWKPVRAFDHTDFSAAELASDEVDVSAAYISIVSNILLSEPGSGIRVVSKWLNAASVRCSRSQLEQIAALPFVSRLDAVRSFVRPHVDSTPSYQAYAPDEYLRSESLHRRQVSGDTKDDFFGYSIEGMPAGVQHVNQDEGFYGQGVRVLVIDGGFDLSHEVFRNLTVLDTRNFISNNTDVASIGPLELPTQLNHGTGVLSVMAAYKPGTMVGSAYRAEYLLAKTEITGNISIRAEEDWFVAAVEWGIKNNVTVISASLGYPEWYTWINTDGTTPVSTAVVNKAVANGVSVVLAVGNQGDDGIAPPADAPDAIAVGAITTAGVRPSWSVIGPTFAGRIKPDLVAHGVQVFVASNTTGNYTRLDGTSFSAPLIAATVVLLKQLKPAYTPRQIRLALLRTASTQPPNRFVGWGRVNLTAASEFPTPLNACTRETEDTGCVTGQGQCDGATGECTCQPGYFDYDCKYPKVLCRDFCNSTGGTCGATGVCTCRRGYTGFDCSTPPDAVASSSGDKGFVLTDEWKIGIAFLCVGGELAHADGRRNVSACSASRPFGS